MEAVAGTTSGRPSGRMHKARVDCFCFFFSGTSGLAPAGGGEGAGGSRAGTNGCSAGTGGSPEGEGTGGSPEGQGQGQGQWGGRLPPRSKATPFIIFKFIGRITSFLVCNSSIAGNAPPQGALEIF